MNKLQAAGLGAVIGLGFGILHVASATEYQIAEAEKSIQPMPIVKEYVPVATQFMKDADVILEEWQEENKAPYECIPLKEEYQSYLEKRCADYEVDYFLMVALMESESQFDEDAEGDKHIGSSVGLMQINAIWWDAMESRGLDVFDSYDNMEASLIILSDYLDRYKDPATAVQMYKCGESRGRELYFSGVILPQCKDVVERADEIKKEATR